MQRTRSDDGPIVWARPGEQMIPTTGGQLSASVAIAPLVGGAAAAAATASGSSASAVNGSASPQPKKLVASFSLF